MQKPKPFELVDQMILALSRGTEVELNKVDEDLLFNLLHHYYIDTSIEDQVAFYNSLLQAHGASLSIPEGTTKAKAVLDLTTSSNQSVKVRLTQAFPPFQMIKG